VSRDAVSSSLTDEELVSQVRAGEDAVFAAIVERYEERLYNTVYRIVGSAEDARDILQETFVKAYENLGTFRGNSSLYTWLFRIAVNTSLSHRRRRKWVQMGGSPGDDGDADDAPSVPVAAEADPSSPLMAAETEAMVQQAIGSLDVEHRTVVVLRDIQHCDYHEIAAILDLPTGTVKSRLHRARLLLKERLRPVLSC
jgi:RNA polymerase sigma-70 factor (ECF subfamily)